MLSAKIKQIGDTQVIIKEADLNAYLAVKAKGSRQASKLVRDVLDLFAVAPVDGHVLDRAWRLGFDDFEDAVVHEAARACGAAGIVTRNGGDFGGASLPVFDPWELLSAVLTAGD